MHKHTTFTTQQCNPVTLPATDLLLQHKPLKVKHSRKTLGGKAVYMLQSSTTGLLTLLLLLSDSHFTTLFVASVLSVIAQVGEPFSYLRESWLMEKDEKMQLVPTLHRQGNTLVQEKCYHEASEKYKEAVLLLRTVQSRVM